MSLKVDSKWDMSFFDQLQERTTRLDQVSVEYGYFEDKTHEASGLPIGSLALIHEYGSVKRNIPARPFVFYSVKLLNDKDISAMRKGMIDYLFKRKDANASFKPVGVTGVRTIQRSIMSQRFTPLAPKTVAKKGSSTILVETSELLNSAEYKINEKS